MSKQKTLSMKELEAELTKSLDEIVEQGNAGYYTAKVTSVTLSTNTDFYGAKEGIDETQGYVLEIGGGNKFFIPVHSDRPNRGKLGKFIRKYKQLPKVGMSVEVDITGDFDQIKLD